MVAEPERRSGSIDLADATPELQATVRAMQGSVQAVSRAMEIKYEAAEGECELDGVRVGLVPREKQPKV